MAATGVYSWHTAPVLHRLRGVRDSAWRARPGDVDRLPRAHPIVQRQEFPGQFLCHGHAVADLLRKPGSIQRPGRESGRRHAVCVDDHRCRTGADGGLVVLRVARARLWRGSRAEEVQFLRRHADDDHQQDFPRTDGDHFHAGDGFQFRGQFRQLHHDLLSLRWRRAGGEPAAGDHRHGLGRDGARGGVSAELAGPTPGQEEHAARGDFADVRRTAVEDRLLPSGPAGHDSSCRPAWQRTSLARH